MWANRVIWETGSKSLREVGNLSAAWIMQRQPTAFPEQVQLQSNCNGPADHQMLHLACPYLSPLSRARSWPRARRGSHSGPGSS
jgi:hypothetical protein